MRTPRCIRAGRPYELMIRAREGLPFVTNEYMRLLLESALARAQRDAKVTVCHYLWMGNHAHVILVPRDAEKGAKFYQELQKKITEYVKRLLGRKRLSLWEGSAILAELGTAVDVIDRIAYIYGNPSEANLVESIEEYPGLSTWWRYRTLETTVDASVTYRVPWIRQPAVEALSSPTVSLEQDRAISDKLRAGATIWHDLTVQPNAWMRCFKVNDSATVKELNQKAIELLREREAEFRKKRAGAAVLGAIGLQMEAIMKPHTPPERERRIFIITHDNDLRMEHIERMKKFTQQCRECYRRWREGNDIDIPWPAGAFRPPLRPLANAVVL